MIISIYLFIIYFTNKNENFLLNQDNTNSYYKPLKNIFLTDNYYNYIDNHPKNNEKSPESLNKIKLDSFLYSKPTTQKIICSSHTNRANCWEDNVNNCQWVYKIDNGSYCDVAPIWL
jgi:hypothetical protein